MVHRTRLAADETAVFALQLLRDQLGRFVYPIHRLDRKTSGVLMFGLEKDVVREVQFSINERKVTKRYIAIVRGYFPEQVELDYPLTNDRGKVQESETHFKCLDRVELDIPMGKHPTSRYSLLEIFPRTGRMHQIRKHLNHLRHPIIGDRPHGCNKQNRLFKEKWNMLTMMLHARSYTLRHPVTTHELRLEADWHNEFDRMLNVLGFDISKI